MQDEIRKLLLDIQISANSIADYLGQSKNFNDYKSNKMLRRAVEREFEIIGEALNRLLKLEPDIQNFSKEPDYWHEKPGHSWVRQN